MIEIGEGVRPSMALELNLQADQIGQAPLSPENLFLLAKDGHSWHVRLDGRLVALGGYALVWPGRAVVWGYLGRDAGPAMPAMTRRIRCELARAAVPRYEAYAGVRHTAARRWLKLLGFRKEGTMRQFMLGGDFVMFARVG